MARGRKPVAGAISGDVGAGGRGSRPLDDAAPCYLLVGDAGISEADIAREMQHHCAGRPEQSRADAARALVVRELLRREVERLGLGMQVRSTGDECAEEAGIRVLLEREIKERIPSKEDCRRYFDQNRERFRSPDRRLVRHILLGAPSDDVTARCDARNEGERLIRELVVNPGLFY
jgi:peptidyl-prolyl cis-trans isomerase C